LPATLQKNTGDTEKNTGVTLDSHTMSDVVIALADMNASSIEPVGSGNVSGARMGGEPLKLILLSAMFSLSVLVKPCSRSTLPKIIFVVPSAGL
jgi:hypothetical protein